jgi:glycerol uptake facilitator-like aquaporin
MWVFCLVFMFAAQIDKKSKKREILWIIIIAICAFAGAVSGAMLDPSSWNYTETTHWVVQGTVTHGPMYNFIMDVVITRMLLLNVLTTAFISRLTINVICGMTGRSKFLE